MFNRTYELFLFDVYIAIVKIENTVDGFDNAQTLLYDYNAWDSVIREFEIIGEATNYLIKNIKAVTGLSAAGIEELAKSGASCSA